ncbi:DUF624 domain-containing protein [Enterococcus sp. LJL99]
MNKLFSYEGWYYRVFSFMADLIILSFLFLVPALTIIMSGPALIALYQTIDQLYKEKDIPIWRSYSQTFIANIKRGLLLEGLIIGYSAGIGLFIFGLMSVTSYFSILVVILTSLAALFLTVFIVLFCLFSASIKETAHETMYALLSNTANAIILLTIPLLVFVVLNKVNIFLFLCLGVSGFVLLQVIFFNKVLAKDQENNE